MEGMEATRIVKLVRNHYRIMILCGIKTSLNKKLNIQRLLLVFGDEVPTVMDVKQRAVNIFSKIPIRDDSNRSKVRIIQ